MVREAKKRRSIFEVYGSVVVVLGQLTLRKWVGSQGQPDEEFAASWPFQVKIQRQAWQ